MRDVVNENDEVVGQADKADIAARGLICRVAFIILINRRGELLLQQRSATKKAYPLYWSGAAAGHLISGESYETGAHRELMEELGVDAPLTFVGKFYSETDREMVGVFVGFFDGELRIEPHEIAQVEAFTLERLKTQAPRMKITSFVERSLPYLFSYLEGQNRSNRAQEDC